VEAMQRQTHLLEVVLAPRPVGGFADLLDRRQEKANEDRNDRDDDKQLNQCECPPAGHPQPRMTAMYVHSAVYPEFPNTECQRQGGALQEISRRSQMKET
jgi:hypothetical protein